MKTLRDHIKDRIEYFVTFEDAKLCIPYPKNSDEAGVSLQELQKIPGFATVMKTVNGNFPGFVKSTSLKGILPLLSDNQVLAILEDVVEGVTEKHMKEDGRIEL